MGVASDLIRGRLRSCSFPTTRELSDDELSEQMASCSKALAGEGWRVTHELDASDDTTEELREWLRRHVRDVEAASVVWLSYRFGIVAPLQAVFTLLGEIWQPSSDDLWIQGPADAILLNHEERVTVFTKSSSG